MVDDEKYSTSLRALHPGPLPSETRLPPQGLVLGRDAAVAGILISRDGVSRRHCWVGPDGDGGWLVRDLDSRNGVFVNGQRIVGHHPLVSGDVIGLGRSRLGDVELDVNGGEREVVLSGNGPWQLGRALDCELSLPADPGVSLVHARLQRRGQQLALRDLGSRNGCWQNGRRVRRCLLNAGDTLELAGSRLLIRSIGADIRLLIGPTQRALGARIEGLSATADPRGGLSMELLPARLQLAVIADSEQRRSLVDMLAGMRAARTGRAHWNEPSLDQGRERLRFRVGRVAEMDLPICGLSGAQWLEQQASLAAAGDLDAAARRQRTQAALDLLGAAHLADLSLDRMTRLEQVLMLIAAELLPRPGLLVLDLPALVDGKDDRAELIDRLQRAAGSTLTVLVASDSPLEELPEASDCPVSDAPAPAAAPAAKKLPRARGFSRAAWLTLLGEQLRGWRRQPLMLIEALALPLVLLGGLWLALPELEMSWILPISVGLAAALGAAFQVSRRPGRLLRAARRHLLLDDALLAMFSAAALVVLCQLLSALALLVLLPDTSLDGTLVAAAALTALASCTLGLSCGLIAGARAELALVLVTVAAGLSVLAGSLADAEQLNSKLRAAASLVSPSYWGQHLAAGGWDGGAILAGSLLLIQTLLLLLLSRRLLRRRL